MSSWMVLALAASLCWGTVNILDKVILSKYNLTPWTYLALDGFISVVSLALFAFISPFSISSQAIALSILSGVFIAAFNILYFFSLSLSDVSIIVILIQITPVFSLIWGVSILGEKYGAINYLGMFLVLIGTVIASLSENKIKTKLNFSRTLFASGVMAVAAFSLSIAYLLQKMALVGDANVLAVFTWQRTSLFIISLIVIAMNFKKFFKLTYQPIILTTIVEVINIAGFLFITTAYAIGSLSKVTFFASLQPAFVVLIIWIAQPFKLYNVPRVKSISPIMVFIACAFVLLGLFLMNMT